MAKTETATKEREQTAKPGQALLVVEDLHAGVEGRDDILKGISLTVRRGEVHALMGPNGSGKSTLSYVLMGRPGYRVTKGRILLNGEDILELKPDERARRGLFLAFQYPQEIPGVSVTNSGGPDLASELEKTGYDSFKETSGKEASGDADEDDRGPLP